MQVAAGICDPDDDPRRMRRMLVDYARRRSPRTNGGKDSSDLLRAIGAALDQLSDLDPRLAHIVELRFFARLTLEEIAVKLKLSERTVKRDLLVAMSFLAAKWNGSEPPSTRD